MGSIAVTKRLYNNLFDVRATRALPRIALNLQYPATFSSKRIGMLHVPRNVKEFVGEWRAPFHRLKSDFSLLKKSVAMTVFPPPEVGEYTFRNDS